MDASEKLMRENNSTKNNSLVENEKAETTLEVVLSCRWIAAYMTCICFMFLNALRSNMGIAMICIVNSSDSPTNVTVVSSNQNDSQVQNSLEWDKTLQGLVLSSYFYGYIATQIPGGYLAGRFGGKKVAAVGLIGMSLSNLLIPLAIKYNWKKPEISAYSVIGLRVSAGLSSGVMVPALQSLWSRWAPPFERSKLTVFCSSGQMIGNVLMLSFGGLFCQWTEFDGGWPSIFYIVGGAGLAYCIFWSITVYDSPITHPRISVREKIYLANALNQTTLSKNKTVPWCDIVKSPAVWAIIVAHVCGTFGEYTLTTKLPAYMSEVLHMDIKSNGLYSSLPHLATLVISILVSHVVDKLREKQILTTILSRKLVMVIAYVLPAFILIGLGHISSNQTYLGVVLLTLAIGITGFKTSGYSVNTIDIGLSFAGEVIGISNTFATIPGIVSPILVNHMTKQGTHQEWQRVFYIWSGIYVLGAIFFVLFAKGEPEPWAITNTDNPDPTTKIGHEEDVQLAETSTT